MIKNWFLNHAIKMVKKYYLHYDDTKIEQLRYGLEGIYLTISKLIIIFLFAIYLGIFIEVLWLTLLFNIIRLPSFGVHASRSSICLIASSLIFLGVPLILKHIVFTPFWKYSICLICLISFILYAPADTPKRPIISPVRRKKLKILSVIVAILFIIKALTTSNIFMANNFLAATMVQAIMIMPITYKLFKQSYNNYQYFKKSS